MVMDEPVERTMETEMFGQGVTFDYSETWIGYAVLSLRLVMAYVFLSAGIEKLLAPGGWSSAAFLDPQSGFGVVQGNPLAGFFAELSAQAALVDPLVVGGQILIGLALLFGVLVRFAVFWGTLQMLLFWAAAWQGGLLEGLPVAHGYVVDSTLVYALLLFGLGAVGAGRILGLDAHVEETDLVEQNPWLRYLLG